MLETFILQTNMNVNEYNVKNSRFPFTWRVQWSPAQPQVLQTPLLIRRENLVGCSEIWTAVSPNYLLRSGPRSQLCPPSLVAVSRSAAAGFLTSLHLCSMGSSTILGEDLVPHGQNA